jgi:hypothetical protein
VLESNLSQCRLCGTSFPPRTFDACEIVAPIASAIALTGTPCSFGQNVAR